MIPNLPAYPLLFGAWIVGAIAWYLAANSLGRQSDSPGDGCLLGIANVLLTFVGGGVGILCAPYPWSLLTSVLGVVLLPGLLTLYALTRNHR